MTSIKILYQDKYFIAVEKPINLLVHPYKKESNERDHLMKQVKAQTGLYLYPIHRLDRPVSGVVIFGLAGEYVKEVKNIWHKPSTQKRYIALVKGILSKAGEFSFSLQKEDKSLQEAITLYKPIQTFLESTLVEVEIKTGRRHQIRRHFARRCHNILGDKKHGQGKLNKKYLEFIGLDRIFLHAKTLEFTHPYTDELITIESPLPEALQECLKKLM